MPYGALDQVTSKWTALQSYEKDSNLRGVITLLLTRQALSTTEPSQHVRIFLRLSTTDSKRFTYGPSFNPSASDYLRYLIVQTFWAGGGSRNPFSGLEDQHNLLARRYTTPAYMPFIHSKHFSSKNLRIIRHQLIGSPWEIWTPDPLFVIQPLSRWAKGLLMFLTTLSTLSRESPRAGWYQFHLGNFTLLLIRRPRYKPIMSMNYN